ncbi:MAG: hypothetical protein M2R45_05472 [Verrucomicrobia subdivision 3 bacterium]|nr:hypothetical protein [Limisphaerales bacterium]MCS1417890.1 hypothetical protein [Limisphaerales bacterium]
MTAASTPQQSGATSGQPGTPIPRGSSRHCCYTESAKTPILATGATLASSSLFSTAMIIGLALVMSALTVIAGNGPVDRLTGIAHGQEFVVSAPAVKRFRMVLEAIKLARTSHQ